MGLKREKKVRGDRPRRPVKWDGPQLDGMRGAVERYDAWTAVHQMEANDALEYADALDAYRLRTLAHRSQLFDRMGQ